MFQTEAVEKIKIHLMRSNVFLKIELFTWKNMVESDRPQMKI